MGQQDPEDGAFIGRELRNRLTRRVFVRRGALLGAAAGLLAACGSSSSSSPSSTSTVSSQSGSGAPSSSQPAASSSTPVAGGTLTYVMPDEPETLNPAISSSRYDGHVIIEVFDSLLTLTPDLSLNPGLVTKWEISTDGLTYTLHLRDGVKFHDGTAFNAQSVVDNLNYIVDPATKSEGEIFSIQPPYKSSKTTDNLTVTVTASQAYGPFLPGLGSLYMISPAAITKYGHDLYNHPVGTGPFVFKEWVPKDHATVTKNPDYNWAPSTYHHNGAPYLDELVFKFTTEDGTRLAQLQSGEADLILVVPPDQFASLSKDSKYKVATTLVSGTPPNLAFNYGKSPTSDLQFRQALMYALSDDDLNQVVNYGAWKTDTGILTASTSFFDPKVTRDLYYPHNPDKAKQLLDGLGWKLDGSVRKKNGQELTLLYLTLPEEVATAEAVQAQLKDYGITVQIKSEANPAQINDAQKGVQDIVWVQWSGTDPSLLSTVFDSKNVGSGWNFAHVKNSDVDNLLDQQAQETDVNKRSAIFGQLQTKLMELAAIYPLWPLNRLWGMKANVQGFAVAPGGETFTAYDTWLSK